MTDALTDSRILDYLYHASIEHRLNALNHNPPFKQHLYAAHCYSLSLTSLLARYKDQSTENHFSQVHPMRRAIAILTGLVFAYGDGECEDCLALDTSNAASPVLACKNHELKGFEKALEWLIPRVITGEFGSKVVVHMLIELATQCVVLHRGKEKYIRRFFIDNLEPYLPHEGDAQSTEVALNLLHLRNERLQELLQETENGTFENLQALYPLEQFIKLYVRYARAAYARIPLPTLLTHGPAPSLDSDTIDGHILMELARQYDYNLVSSPLMSKATPKKSSLASPGKTTESVLSGMSHAVKQFQNTIRDPLPDIVGEQRASVTAPAMARNHASPHSAKKDLLQRAESAHRVNWSDNEGEPIAQNSASAPATTSARRVHSPFQIPQDAQNILHRTPLVGRETTFSGARKRKRFSTEEVAWLIDGIKRFGIGHWAKIQQAYPFEDRTPKDLQDKYKNLCKAGMAF